MGKHKEKSSKKHKKEKSSRRSKDKKHSHRRDRSSSSSSSSEDEERVLRRLEKERILQKQRELEKKETYKKYETPEEKRVRRMQKKELKERKRKEKMGWDSEYLHYTNADNPYGDNNLLETFHWGKKLEKEGLANLAKEEIEKRNRAKMEQNRLELEKVKKRRLEREMERAERDKLMELEQRQKEAAQFSQFSKKEDSFQLEQARIRSQIRIEDSRAKPIDLLAQYINSEGDTTNSGVVHVHEPYTHLTGLTLDDLEDLMEDIKVYQKLDTECDHQWYWTDLTVIVLDEIRRLRKRDLEVEMDGSSQRDGIHSSVADEVSQVFRNKTVSELNKLQGQFETKLSGDTAGVDISYWESLLSQLKAFQARARLKERHKENLKSKLELLKAEQGVKTEAPDIEPSEDTAGPSTSYSPTLHQIKKDEDTEEAPEESSSQDDNSDDEVSQLTHRDVDADKLIESSLCAYDQGRFSPKLVKISGLEAGTDIVEVEEDFKRLEWRRQEVQGGGGRGGMEKMLTEEERRLQKEAQKNMDGDEVQFSVEAKLDPTHYLWSDKYRPRKPRYFNRVHTGFEWNKYNQTHYDMDNPPPKIVQGYKFNIFFPDLIEKSSTPQYELIPIDNVDNKDFAMLKFSAGPPYEDIAFKIVNREWEYSYKRGFRCQFHNNIFQLWFHFKRYRYRR